MSTAKGDRRRVGHARLEKLHRFVGTRCLLYAIRQFISKPAFTAVAVASMAIGIGATTAIFSIVHAILMDPFPYRSSERIGSLWVTDRRGQPQGLSYTPGQYLEIRRRMRVIEDVIAFKTSTSVLTEPGFPQIITHDECSRNLFDFFGVPPFLGHVFSAREENPQGSETSVAVLSYAFWQHTFQGRIDILGQRLRANHILYTVIGVLPGRFTWSDADMYTPIEIRPGSAVLLNVLYRMRPHVSENQISKEFTPALYWNSASQSPALVVSRGRLPYQIRKYQGRRRRQVRKHAIGFVRGGDVATSHCLQ